MAEVTITGDRYYKYQTAELRIENLRRLCGYVENGSDTTVKITQDDATKSWIVMVGNKRYHGESFYEALDAAITDLKE